MSILENPSVYQYIVRKGLEEGLEQGLEQGRQLEVSLIRRQLQRLIGALDDRQSQHIAEMTTEQLGRLGEALLDFNGPADLVAWLAEFG